MKIIKIELLTKNILDTDTTRIGASLIVALLQQIGWVKSVSYTVQDVTFVKENETIV